MMGSTKTPLLTSIVAIDRNGAIGCRNELPWKLKTDMDFFKASTVGNTVIMGRKTYDSIGCCLPRRTNVVLSHNNVLFAATPKCQLAMSVQESLYFAHIAGNKEIFVIGGALTYSHFAPIVDRYLVTIVDHEVPDADAFLDDDILASIQQWDPKMLSKSSSQEGVDEHSFVIYEVLVPNAEERRIERENMVEAYADAINIKQPSKRSKIKNALSFSQDAFAF